jgi:formylglycine-generating enzyme
MSKRTNEHRTNAGGTRLGKTLLGLVFTAIVVAAVPSCTRAEPQIARASLVSINAAVIARPSEDERELQKNAGTHPEPSAVNNAEEAEATERVCPAGMLLVEGDYCPEVEQTCLEWMDPPGTKYAQFRCKRYKQPSVCKGERVHMRYCIDQTERTEQGTKTPKNFVSFHEATSLCASDGARVCKESEWQFACEGEAMLPYPYGFDRDETACNTDRFKDLKKNGRLVDHRAEAGSHERCTSPFGVQDLAGNMEEWVAADGGSKFGWKQVLKGSWWIPSRHACRQFQIGHTAVYGGAEVGTRCCKDL